MLLWKTDSSERRNSTLHSFCRSVSYSIIHIISNFYHVIFERDWNKRKNKMHPRSMWQCKGPSRGALLKLYLLKLDFFLSLIESFFADASVQLILRHPPSSAQGVAVKLRLDLCFHQLTVHTLSWYDIYRNEYPDMISISTSKHALTLNKNNLIHVNAMVVFLSYIRFTKCASIQTPWPVTRNDIQLFHTYDISDFFTLTFALLA